MEGLAVSALATSLAAELAAVRADWKRDVDSLTTQLDAVRVERDKIAAEFVVAAHRYALAEKVVEKARPFTADSLCGGILGLHPPSFIVALANALDAYDAGAKK